MSPRPLNDSELIEAVKARAEAGGNVCAAARSLNVSENCLRNRLAHAAQRGLCGTAPVLPGYAIKSISTQLGPEGSLQKEWVRQTKEPGETFTPPADHMISGLSVLTDGEGREVARWTKTKAGSDPLAAVEAVKAAFDGWQPRAVATAAPICDADLATVHVLPDLHVGLLTDRREVGMNWDVKIAEDVLGGAIDRMVAGAPSSGLGIVLGLGDLMHSDGYEPVTPTSRHPLDVDGRYPRVLKAAVQLFIRAVEAAKEKHAKVLVRVLSGNHDIQSSIAVALALSLYYANEPRVTVDDDPSYYWWHLFGTTLLGATHGDAARMQDLPIIMASRNPEAWGKSKFRAVLTGHVHHRSAIEVSGVTVESFQAPVPSDGYHHKAGYSGGRSLTSITYHREHGEVGRNKVNILPSPALNSSRRAA